MSFDHTDFHYPPVFLLCLIFVFPPSSPSIFMPFCVYVCVRPNMHNQGCYYKSMSNLPVATPCIAMGFLITFSCI